MELRNGISELETTEIKRTVSLLILFTALSFTAACAGSPMLNGVNALPRPTADSGMDSTEMPAPQLENAHNQKIKKASAEATILCRQQLSCSAVRVVRADSYIRADGTSWMVVRLNACGEERVYEKTRSGWNDATSRLR